MGGHSKCRLGTGGNPHFEDFMNPKEGPATKTNRLLCEIRKIRQASLNPDFSNKLNLALQERVRETEMSNSFYAVRFSFYRQIGEIMATENGWGRC